MTYVLRQRWKSREECLRCDNQVSSGHYPHRAHARPLSSLRASCMPSILYEGSGSSYSITKGQTLRFRKPKRSSDASYRDSKFQQRPTLPRTDKPFGLLPISRRADFCIRLARLNEESRAASIVPIEGLEFWEARYRVIEIEKQFAWHLRSNRLRNVSHA